MSKDDRLSRLREKTEGGQALIDHGYTKFNHNRLGNESRKLVECDCCGEEFLEEEVMYLEDIDRTLAKDHVEDARAEIVSAKWAAMKERHD